MARLIDEPIMLPASSRTPLGGGAYWIDLGKAVGSYAKGQGPMLRVRQRFLLRIHFNTVNSELNTWLSAHLFDLEGWYPDRIGSKHLICKRRIRGALLALALDPAPKDEGWINDLVDLSAVEFFVRTRAFIGSNSIGLFLNFADDAYSVLHWCLELESAMWSESLLFNFEQIPRDQGGPQFLVVLIRERTGALVITRSEVVEIAYYGPDDLWEEISTALYSPKETANAT